MTPPATQRIGPYEIEGELGRGGMGVVYRARDASGRAVAIKRIAVRDEDLARRLLREADVRIVHPNVVRVLGAGLDARGEPYVATELLEGESLHDRLSRDRARGVVDVPALVRLFAQAADGLAALHAAGIVHRDIKPSNLFVTTGGALKVLDFGTAAFSDASTILTAAGALLGTPAYLSPEQARGEIVDGRSDVWSLGMSLYQALSGELPFRRSSVVACALAVQTESLPELSLLAPSVPLELAALVEHCLMRRPEDRPQTADELARLLRAVSTTTAGRPSRPLLAHDEETWRPVAIVLIEDGDRARLEPRAAALGGVIFPVFARSAVVVFGAATSHGDELERAIELALMCRDPRRTVVVGDARARAGGRELDPESLRAASDLLERGSGGVLLTAPAAAFAGAHLRLVRETDGSARVLDVSAPAAATAIDIVGRDAELAALEEAARRASEESAPAHVEIAGEAGMGKTALVRAFLARLGTIVPGARSVSGRARHTDTAPYAPLLEALEVEAPEGGAPQDALDRRRVGVIDRLGELLVASPLVVVVVEDVHDADPRSASLLHELRALFEDRALLLVTTARAFPAVAAQSTVRLSLGPLGAASIGSLVARILGGEAARRVAVELGSRAGGNPLFAVHLAQLASARGELSSVDSWDIPLTVESAVQSRLDALSVELRSATHTMAVLGSEGTLAEARWALGARGDGWLAGLASAGVLDLHRRADRATWQFQSRIVAEVARAALDRATATRLHREIAERLAPACEAGSPGAPDSEAVLRHAERGGHEELTQRYVREAFLRAARIGDGRRALELLPRARTSPGPLFPIALAAAEAAAFVGDGPEVEPLLREALAHATTPDERARARAELGERARRAARLTEARTHLEGALAETSSHAIATRTRCRLALIRVSEGDAPGALQLVETAGVETLSAAVRALVADTQGYVHGARGALGPRCEAYERAARLYAEAGDARRAAGASANLGDTLRQIGDFAQAQVALRRAIDGARRVGNGLTEAYACTNLAATLSTLGRRREALATLEIAAARADAVGDHRLELVIALHRARAEERAPRELDLERVRSRDDPTLSAMALAVLLDHGAPREAHLDEAAALLARFDAIEEGALEIGRALYARRPTEEIRGAVIAQLEWSYRSLDRPEQRARFVEHVARGFADLAAPWLRARSSA